MSTTDNQTQPKPLLENRRLIGYDMYIEWQGLIVKSMSRTRGYIHPGIGQDLSFFSVPPSSVCERVHIIHYADGAGWFTKNHLYVQT